VDVSANLEKYYYKENYSDWGLDVLHVGLLEKDFFGAVAEGFDLRLLYVLAPLQLGDPVVNVVVLLLALLHFFLNY
jgi:hypothetical protein